MDAAVDVIGSSLFIAGGTMETHNNIASGEVYDYFDWNFRDDNDDRDDQDLDETIYYGFSVRDSELYNCDPVVSTDPVSHYDSYGYAR